MAWSEPRSELPEDATYIKDGIKAYLQDKSRETQGTVNKDLNLLSLRRWQYDHPEDYEDFTNLFAKAYEGDVTFFIKGMSYLAEMLSLNGITSITDLLESLCPGTESYNKAQFASSQQQVHEKLTILFVSTFNQEATKQKILHNNPFMCSAFYWMIFDDTYNYRTFHTAILEKFPSIGFKSGFDWGEALYNAIVSERGNDYNLSLSEKTVQTGKEQAKLISIRLRTLLSPDVY